jgi:hypothetical protein
MKKSDSPYFDIFFMRFCHAVTQLSRRTFSLRDKISLYLVTTYVNLSRSHAVIGSRARIMADFWAEKFPKT